MSKNRKAQEVAATEGITCTDCIHEALMYIGQDAAIRINDARVPAEKMQRFREALHDEERLHAADNNH